MKIVKILKALGDENRIRIVNILRNGPLCVCEIESILEISQSNASRHLNKLMNANLVNYYKEAKYVYYKLNEDILNEYSFINIILKDDIDKEEILKFDYEILIKYKESNLNCETVTQIRDSISKIKSK